jgi:hypothetical protein
MKVEVKQSKRQQGVKQRKAMGEAKKRNGISSTYQALLVGVAYVVSVTVFGLPEEEGMVAHLQRTYRQSDRY